MFSIFFCQNPCVTRSIQIAGQSYFQWLKIGALAFETDSRLLKLDDFAFLRVPCVRFMPLDQSTFLVIDALAARRLNP
jgi:hypothetical protein